MVSTWKDSVKYIQSHLEYCWLRYDCQTPEEMKNKKEKKYTILIIWAINLIHYQAVIWRQTQNQIKKEEVVITFVVLACSGIIFMTSWPQNIHDPKIRVEKWVG